MDDTHHGAHAPTDRVATASTVEHAYDRGATVVLHTGGLNYASEKAVLEKAFGSRPGVLSVEANPVAQTANVRYDPNQTSVAELRRWG